MEVFLIDIRGDISMKYLIFAVAIILGESVTSRTTLSEEIASQTRNGINFTLAYIGTFNQKLYYIDNTGANNTDARSNCQSMGMRLFKIEAIVELEWIVNTTGNRWPYIWTDAVGHIVPASFEWKTTGGRVSDSVNVVKDTYYGLTLLRNSRTLVETLLTAAFPYICYMNLARNQLLPEVPFETPEIETLSNSVDASVDGNVRLSPKLSFIGRYGRKSYFLESGNKAGQDEARNNCTAMGMRLATIDSQAELEFIISVTITTDRPIWTDAVFKNDPSSFRWSSDNSPLLSELKTLAISLGLHIRNEIGLYSWNIAPTTRLHYLCYVETS